MPTISDRNLIQQFIDSSVVAKRDYQLLDMLWTFSYCLLLTFATGFRDCRKEFNKGLGTTCKRNLQMKHQSPQIKEKMNIFLAFLNSMPDFLSYETYDEDRALLDKILKNRTSMMLAENTEERLRAISPGLDAEILSFVLNYIPERIQESLQKAEEHRAVNHSYSDKYMWLSDDFDISENKETGEIDYFKTDTKEWTYLFNVMFNQELREYRFKSKSYEQYDEYSFWQFGDELVKLGVGYWAVYVTSSCNVTLHLIIPKFIYDVMQPYKEKLPQIVDISAKVSQIIKEQIKDKWALGDLEDTQVGSEVSESEIEHFIVSNPSVLGEGLEVVGRQFTTRVGSIDILCKDKNENLAVVELKKGTGSFEVVGQILKYMTWVHENLAEGKQVRGIIVAKTYDEQLEHAIRGSRFPIEIKIFGEEAPIQENIRYCDNCGKPNRKSAKYCVKCGKEFYL